jgi:glycosyltransferase involved in cell wall biosynthesis
MTKFRLVAHTVVRNEECWIWYCLASALPFVDSQLVWDTGSTDTSIAVVTTLHNPKIQFKKVAITADETALSAVRQQMLEATNSDWLMILDGDEIWPDASLKKIIEFISLQGENYDSIVVPTLNCVGDVYHISPPKLGRYKIAGHSGHLNLRFINLRRVTGLHVANLPGQLQSYYDGSNTRVQDRDSQKIAFVDAPYLHMTHLARSTKRMNETNVFWRSTKKKTILGIALKPDFNYPIPFYYARPEIVPDPWKHRSFIYILLAVMLALPRYLKSLIRG